MKLFSEITEARRPKTEINTAELQEYTNKMRKKLPEEVDMVLQYLNNFNITDREIVDKILNSPKSSMKNVIIDIPSMSLEDALDMQKLLKNLKGNIKLLPMYMDDNTREDVTQGRKTATDITLDLETEKGRAECAKQYASLVIAIASKYKGKSGLDWNGLISAGQLGLTKAMNDYHKPEEHIDVDDSIAQDSKGIAKKAKGQTFKQYAGWRIRNQILNDINALSRTVRITQHEYEKNKAAGNTKGNFNTVSIDLDDDQTTNHIPDIVAPQSVSHTDRDEMWSKLYQIIDNKFSSRDASVFYKYFGVRDYKQQTGVEIAKEIGVTGARISLIIGKILKYLKGEPKAAEYLSALRDMYSESIISMNYNKSKEQILEALINDDIYIMLEDITHWTNKRVFNNAVGEALEYFDPEKNDILLESLHADFDFIDSNYHENKKLYVNFLEHLYPTECIKKKTDIDILNRMIEINEYFHKHNLSE